MEYGLSYRHFKVNQQCSSISEEAIASPTFIVKIATNKLEVLEFGK